jgi:hypothetical protein
MTSALKDFDRSSRRRPLSLTPYGLLLVLALFLAGQIASAAHWHDAVNQLDTDCALCMLSTANGAAALASGWQLPTVLVAAFTVILLSSMVRRTVVRFHDSRAPPSLS